MSDSWSPASSKFGELKPLMGRNEAVAEADRCLFCYDAPCTRACPTHIDIPGFIKKIATGNLKGSARTILDANITTLITAIVLFEYGTGPIKGFAVTLSIGVVTSVFAALVVTRLLFAVYPGNRHVESLSI